MTKFPLNGAKFFSKYPPKSYNRDVQCENLIFQIVEVNSELLLQIDRAGWHSLRPGLTCPCHVVVIRNVHTQTNGEMGEIVALCDQHHDR